MSRIAKAIAFIHYADGESAKDRWLNRLHPLTKLVISMWFLFLVVSVHKYALDTLLLLAIFPSLTMLLSEIPFGKTIKKLWPVLLVVCLPGAANIFIDKTLVGRIGGLTVTGGMVSALSLMGKGVLGVLTSFILLSSTSIEKICYALRMLYVPRQMVVLILLIYRYIIVLLKEAERITSAYQMRAPSHKGIAFKAWGTLAGLLLLRSVDRAHTVYESMTLRGFTGEHYMARLKFGCKDALLAGICMALMAYLRFGSLLTILQA